MQTKTALKIIPRILGGDEQIALLILDGYIDSTNAVQLKKEIERLGKKIFRFIINFDGVEYVSSAGWGVILTRIREFRSQKGDIVFIRMPEEVHSVFELLELNQVVKHFTAIEDALKHFGVNEPVSLAELVAQARAEEKSPEREKLTVEDAIRRIVRENPLRTSSQITQTLSSPAYGFKKLNTLKVYFLLRRLGLHTREQKLYYAWQYLSKKTRMET